MSKSAITISYDGTPSSSRSGPVGTWPLDRLVQKRMLSGLFTSHGLDSKISLKVEKANDKGEGQHTRDSGER